MIRIYLLPDCRSISRSLVLVLRLFVRGCRRGKRHGCWARRAAPSLRASANARAHRLPWPKS